MLLKSLRQLGFAAALVFGGLSAAAQAQPNEIAIDPDETWEHEWTEMSFPPQFGPFTRTRMSQFEERGTNLSASYRDDRGTVITIYIYRPGNPSTAIWFDRALVAIGASDPESEGNDFQYGEVDLEDLKIRSFVPSGGSERSGLSAVLAVDGQAVLSTGVALYRAGEWLVKIRISSPSQTVPIMDRTLKTVINELPALADIDPNPAQFVAPCEAPLEPQTVRPIDVDTTAVALGQALMLVSTQMPPSEDGEDAPRLTNPADLAYCREGARDPRFNVFRPSDGSLRYSVAVGDAGYSIEVYPDIVGTEMDEESGMTTFAVQTSSGLEYSLYTPFRGLPTLNQVAQSVNGPLTAKVTRPLEEGVGAEVQIVTDSD